jgi:hypothetical protein
MIGKKLRKKLSEFMQNVSMPKSWQILLLLIALNLCILHYISMDSFYTPNSYFFPHAYIGDSIIKTYHIQSEGILSETMSFSTVYNSYTGGFIRYQFLQPLLYSILFLITDIEIEKIAMVPLLGPLVILWTYIIVRKIFDEKTAILSSAFVAFGSGYLLLTEITPNFITLTMIFLMMSIWSIYKFYSDNFTSKKFLYMFILFICFIATLFWYYSILYAILFILLSLFAIEFLSSVTTRNVKKFIIVTIIGGLFFLGVGYWLIYVSKILVVHLLYSESPALPALSGELTAYTPSIAPIIDREYNAWSALPIRVVCSKIQTWFAIFLAMPSVLYFSYKFAKNTFYSFKNKKWIISPGLGTLICWGGGGILFSIGTIIQGMHYEFRLMLYFWPLFAALVSYTILNFIKILRSKGFKYKPLSIIFLLVILCTFLFTSIYFVSFHDPNYQKSLIEGINHQAMIIKNDEIVLTNLEIGNSLYGKYHHTKIRNTRDTKEDLYNLYYSEKSSDAKKYLLNKNVDWFLISSNVHEYGFRAFDIYRNPISEKAFLKYNEISPLNKIYCNDDLISYKNGLK